MARARRGGTMQDVMGDVLEGTGPSITFTSIVNTVAFLVAAQVFYFVI